MGILRLETGMTLSGRPALAHPRSNMFIVLDPGSEGGDPLRAIRWNIPRRLLADPGEYVINQFSGRLNQRWTGDDLSSWLTSSLEAGSVTPRDRDRVLRWFEEGLIKPSREIAVPADFYFGQPLQRTPVFPS